jgi:hypothetical protein
VRDTYLHLRHGVGAANPAYASREGCAHLFNRLLRQYLTNCQNHVAVNLERRMRGYLNYKMVKYSKAPQNAPPEVQGEWRRFDKSVRRLVVDFFYNCLAVNETPALPNWQSLLAANPRIPALLGGHVLAAVCQAFWALHLLVCKAGQSIRSDQSRRRPPRPGLQLEGVLPPSATDSEKL